MEAAPLLNLCLTQHPVTQFLLEYAKVELVSVVELQVRLQKRQRILQRNLLLYLHRLPQPMLNTVAVIHALN